MEDITLDGELYDVDPIEETCEILAVSDLYLEAAMAEAISNADNYARSLWAA